MGEIVPAPQSATDPFRGAIFFLPVVQVVTDFFDELKSRSQGYASMDYHPVGYRLNDLVRLDIRINQEQIDPLAVIVHRDAAYRVGKGLANRLKSTVPRQQFRIPIQATIGSRVVASESIPGAPPAMNMLCCLSAFFVGINAIAPANHPSGVIPSMYDLGLMICCHALPCTFPIAQLIHMSRWRSGGPGHIP